MPVRNGAAALPALLAGLRRQTLSADSFEVVVVDNASGDETAAVARRAGATVVAEPIANRSRARNRGAAAARSDLFAFTDADCVADPNWLEAMLHCAGSAPLAAGPVRVSASHPPNAVERFEKLWRFSQEDWVRQGWAATANLLVHRSAFDAVGGFDPAYRHIGEDADFCIRAGRAGLRLSFCQEALVVHGAERGLPGLLRRAFLHGYSASQAHRRLGVGEEAWRHPFPLLDGDAAMAKIGLIAGTLPATEWREMRKLARLAYAARVAGSLWATSQRAG